MKQVNFQDTIRELRERKSISQVELGKKLNLTKSVISSYENGVRQPSHDVLFQMARFFGVSMDHMYGINKDVTFENNVYKINCHGLYETDIQIVTDLVRLLKSKNGICSMDTAEH